MYRFQTTAFGRRKVCLSVCELEQGVDKVEFSLHCVKMATDNNMNTFPYLRGGDVDTAKAED